MNMRVAPSRPVQVAYLAIMVVFVGLLGVTDYLTGSEISFSIFYLIPVMAASWMLGRWQGVVLAVVAASAWLVSDLASFSASHPLIPLWNAFVRLSTFLIVSIAMASLKTALERERKLASTDGLTGVANGRAFRATLSLEVERARRFGHTFALVYLDLDNFKTVNDRLGHSTGDTVLRTVAGILAENVREVDLVARLGGDEFAILLPETVEAGADEFTQRLMQKLHEAMAENAWPIGCSIGCATFHAAPASADRALQEVDALMYTAKRGGKDRIERATL